MKKKVLFVADTVDCAKRFASVLKSFEIELVTCRFDQATAKKEEYRGADLAIFELPLGGLSEKMQAQTKFATFGAKSFLFVCQDKDVENMRLPIHLNCDFIVESAKEAEYCARVKNLLFPGSETTQSQILHKENMTINLGTFQVQVGEKPLDLTYLEYTLLTFLVTHPEHSYSRDELLKRVWGFDYLGGSRTVDVHIRRIRAKIGPENASHLETVRGVGYLWSD